MSLDQIRNVVLLFSNPVWAGASTVPSTIIRNITALQSDLAYEQQVSENLTTLTMTSARTVDGKIQGLLYVPDITNNAACNSLQYDFIPPNVTRQADLPQTNYKLIAIAPWFSMDCTYAYLQSAQVDPIAGFIFYKPNNSSDKPQGVDSPVWNLDDHGAWKQDNRYPVFAVPGIVGQNMMQKLSMYSGNVSEVPHGEEIMDAYGPNPSDYVRLYTQLEIKNTRNLMALWKYFIIVIGALLVIVGCVSLLMHLIQRNRRKSLKRRVECGEVDLEASGIKRLQVPALHVKGFPLYTFNAEPDSSSLPPTPSTTGAPTSTRSGRSGRSGRSRSSRRRHHDNRSVTSLMAPSSIRSKRSSIAGSVDTTATNHQPACHICLVKFEHCFSIIRELPCGHIFHPECIDEFLTMNSSLCPQCKHCMLPRGYSPKITNGMVRREKAIRSTRGKVDLDDDSAELGRSRMKLWGQRLFSRSKTTNRDVPLAPIKSTSPPHEESEQSLSPDKTPTPAPDTIREEEEDEHGTASEQSDSGDAPPARPSQATQPRQKPRPRKKRPRALRLLPTHPEDGELPTGPAAGRKSPSAFARKRMRSIAAYNAPFEDPDRQPQWRRVLGHVFPAFS